MTDLAKRVQELNQRMPDETEGMKRAVQTIVEGAITCCSYLLQGKTGRFLSTETMEASLEEICSEIKKVYDDLGIMIHMDIQRKIPSRVRQLQNQLLEIKPVGIDGQVEDVRELLDMEGVAPAVAVVIYGFGGAGKSTIAKSVVSKLNLTDFKLSVVKVDEESTVKTLQESIIFELADKIIDLKNDEQGRHELNEILKKQSCFILIDNVVRKEDIQNLLPREFSLERQKLRILVTSQDKNVVSRELKIPCEEYSVKILSNETAKELLQTTIQETHQISSSKEADQIEAIAKACCGVPLLLEVFGKHLKVDWSEEAYEEALEALRRGLEHGSYKEERLSETLLYVYKKMKDEDAQEAFLDICTFFHKWQKDDVSAIVGEQQLKALESCALVKTDFSNQVIVHDVLRAMGEKEAEPTRLKSSAELKKAIKDKEKLKRIRGLWLVNNKCKFELEAKHIDALDDSLRVLALGDWISFDRPCGATFSKLKFLQVGDLASFPFANASTLEQLTVLHNKSLYLMDLPELPQALKQLEVLPPETWTSPVLSNNGWRNLPKLKNLRKFKFQRFELVEQFPEWVVLPQQSLKEVDLSGCKMLSKLPHQFGRLTQLTKLELNDCETLTVLPEDFHKLCSLKTLSMNRCRNLTQLPEKFGQLSSLNMLDLKYCSSLKQLSPSFGSLIHLQTLILDFCTNLQHLPETLETFASLKELKIDCCQSLVRLPVDFGSKFSFSEVLELTGLTHLMELPESIGNMTNLTKLSLKRCRSLTSLPSCFVKLSSLHTLEISSCNKLSALPPNIGHLSSMKHISLEDCKSLEKLLEGFSGMNIEQLKISATVLMDLPEQVANFRCLKKLSLRINSWLHLPQTFGHHLEMLDLSSSSSLTSLPDGFGQLKSLKVLDLSYCSSLKTLSADFEGLRSLRMLILEDCNVLEGETMKKLVELECLYFVRIGRSEKLIEQWTQMQKEKEYPLAVEISYRYFVRRNWQYFVNRQLFKDAVGVRLMDGQCEVVDRHGKSMLSSHFIHQNCTTNSITFLLVRPDCSPEELHSDKQEFSEKLASNNTQLICVELGTIPDRNCLVNFSSQNHQILQFLPEGTRAVPATDIKTRSLFTNAFDFSEKFQLIVMDVKSDENGRKRFVQRNLSPVQVQEPVEQPLSRPNFSNISNVKQFIELLEMHGIALDFMAKNGTKLVVIADDLNAVFVVKGNPFKELKLRKMCSEIQRIQPNFQAIWMPLYGSYWEGIGSHKRDSDSMPWVTLSDPTLDIAKLVDRECIMLSDEEGLIAEEDRMSTLLKWGADAYPFTKQRIEELKKLELSHMQHHSPFEFIFGECSFQDSSGNMVNRESLRGKMIFLYSGVQTGWLNSKLRSLYADLKGKQTNNFEILCVGWFHRNPHVANEINNEKKEYHRLAKEMPGLKLSFLDVITFWYRCWSLDGAESAYLHEDPNWPKIQRLVRCLASYAPFNYFHANLTVLFDGKGEVVTEKGREVVELLSDGRGTEETTTNMTLKKEWIESLNKGMCSDVLKTIHPLHC